MVLFEQVEHTVGMDKANLHEMLESIFQLTIDGASDGREIKKKDL